MDKFVTYGFDKFDYRMVVENLNLKCFLGKPSNAWWGSPIDSKFGWKEYCENEDFILKNINIKRWRIILKIK